MNLWFAGRFASVLHFVYMTLKKLRSELRALGTSERASGAARYFKTGKGEYAEGDKFIGVTVPIVRKIAKKYLDLPLSDIVELLHSPMHEERLLAVIMLVNVFKSGDEKTRKGIYTLHVSSAEYINNWDLVDTSAPQIIGGYLEHRSRKPLEKLAKSKNLWERRMAIISTLYFIVHGESVDALKIAKMLMNDRHDLIHKATGWMLREVGKRCESGTLESFLDEFGSTMPRTMLRYAIERFPEKKRLRYLRMH